MTWAVSLSPIRSCFCIEAISKSFTSPAFMLVDTLKTENLSGRKVSEYEKVEGKSCTGREK